MKYWAGHWGKQTQFAIDTHSEWVRDTNTWSWGSCKLKAKYGGCSRGKNGFLIAAVESINNSVYIGFARSVQHPAIFLGVSLFISSYHLALIRSNQKWEEANEAITQLLQNKEFAAIQTFFQVMKICLVVALILCPIQIVWGTVSVILYPVAIDVASASVSASVSSSVSANASDPVASNIRSFMVGGNNCEHVNWFFSGWFDTFHWWGWGHLTLF